MGNPLDDSTLAGRAADPSLVREVADLIVTTLNLEIDAAEMDPNAPLYSEGLGLDSIDILEIALVASKRYGFKLNEEEKENMSAFSSVNNLALYIADRRTK